jgi:pimeloyl-ACP methyl ester carboxylesterase
LHGQVDPEFPLGPDLLRGIAESDVLRARTLKEMRERKPDLEVAEFPGVGHAPALMSDDQIRVVREFLLRA